MVRGEPRPDRGWRQNQGVEERLTLWSGSLGPPEPPIEQPIYPRPPGRISAGWDTFLQSMAHDRWTLSPTAPSEWSDDLARCGGGFFHSQLGLELGAPPGGPVYATLSTAGSTSGIALGVRRRCRLGGGRDHLYFPSLPAVQPADGRDSALQSLVDELRRAGSAEVVMDSFDAQWTPGAHTTGTLGAGRWEFLVPLTSDPRQLQSRFGSTHRRHVQRGERDGWVVRQLEGLQAARALREVQVGASERAARRGDGFALRIPEGLREIDAADPRHASTAGIYGAFAGTALLASVLLGAAGGRWYYLMGGSTSEGYRTGAAVWLHYRLMLAGGEQGYSVYNLGGTPASAFDPADPAHGLYRFKSGFGGETIARKGAHWPLLPLHLGLHRLARWMNTRLSPTAAGG